MDGLGDTFVAALRSVGTATTMAMAGFYLHRRKFVSMAGKESLAKMSQQVTIPAFFFSKIIYCPQDFSTGTSCPAITDNLADIWVLALWPLYVVGCGLLVGEAAAWISSAPPHQRKSVIAACAFANSTGLPLTLLTVIHANFPQTSEIGKMNPNLFLSVYSLLYPIMLWGIGGWLLTGGDTADAALHHALVASDTEQEDQEDPNHLMMANNNNNKSISDLLDPRHMNGDNGIACAAPLSKPKQPMDSAVLQRNVLNVVSKAIQPPVVGAIMGMFVASIRPLRGLFVDLVTRSNRAPLEWIFDGINTIGRAAVPISMSILGMNLSVASQPRDLPGTRISGKTIAAIVIGKMVVMPVVGILTVILLKSFVWNIPNDIDAPFYLVMMIVTITPTANSIIVMTELGGSERTEEMARVIGWQYIVSPIILSITVMLVVQVACLG